MAGVKVTVLRKTTTTLPAVEGPGSVFLPPIAEFFNAVGWVSGTLQVRVYDNSLTGATAKVSVAVVNSVVAPEDPAVTLTQLISNSVPSHWSRSRPAPRARRRCRSASCRPRTRTTTPIPPSRSRSRCCSSSRPARAPPSAAASPSAST